MKHVKVFFVADGHPFYCETTASCADAFRD
jgi:hypothetical protein